MWEPRADNVLSAMVLALVQRLRPDQPSERLEPSERLDGAAALITGASSGLGKAAAIALAARGAHVVMACRSGIPAAGDEVRRRSGSSAVEMLPVDLADLASVHRLCDQLRGRTLDLLVLNAGVVPRRARRSAQGFELMFGVNYLAHALLARRLLADGIIPNRLLTSSDAAARRAAARTPERRPRIVVVSSEQHRGARPIDFSALGRYVRYGVLTGLRQYAHTKLLLCTFAQELARRLARAGDVDVAVHSLCPGAVATNIAREAPAWLMPAVDLVMQRSFATPEEAVEPIAYLACARALEGQTGLYLHRMTRKQPARAALDPHSGARLWEATTALLQRAARR